MYTQKTSWDYVSELMVLIPGLSVMFADSRDSVEKMRDKVESDAKAVGKKVKKGAREAADAVKSGAERVEDDIKEAYDKARDYVKKKS